MPTDPPETPTPRTRGPRTYKVFQKSDLATLVDELLGEASPLNADQKKALRTGQAGTTRFVYLQIGQLTARSPEAALQAKADELQRDGVELAACAENRWVEKKGKEKLERSYELV